MVSDIDIKYAKSALKTLQKYDKPTREYIREKIKGLIKTPPIGDIVPLSGSTNEYRLRTGKYRVIFEYLTLNNIKVLMINKIDSRGGIYKE